MFGDFQEKQYGNIVTIFGFIGGSEQNAITI